MATADPMIRAETFTRKRESTDVRLSDLPDDELGALAYAGNEEAARILRQRQADKRQA